MADTVKPTICVNCKSENIIGPFGNRNTVFEVGWNTFLRQKLFVCGDCGYTMQFTIEKDKRKLLERARGKS